MYNSSLITVPGWSVGADTGATFLLAYRSQVMTGKINGKCRMRLQITDLNCEELFFFIFLKI